MFEGQTDRQTVNDCQQEPRALQKKKRTTNTENYIKTSSKTEEKQEEEEDEGEGKTSTHK